LGVRQTTRSPSYLYFDKKIYAWKNGVDYREHPEEYWVGKGEQGVLICEPYKTEIVQHWHFKNPEVAAKSSIMIYQMFEDYLRQDDFVGADMARKFLQMGYTRARRYANYKSGKKYDKNNAYAALPRGTGDPIKAESAAIFYDKWKSAEANLKYAEMKLAWKKQYG
jgi:hypothetical protein